jgi:hypothetical protein
MTKNPDERQEPIYLIEKANKENEFTRKATRINTLKSVPQTESVKVEVLIEGHFYNEGEKLTAVHGNLKTLSEVKKIGKSMGEEVKFNDPQMKNIS